MYNSDYNTVKYLLRSNPELIKSLSEGDKQQLLKSAPPGTIPIQKVVTKPGMAPFQQTFYTVPEKPDTPKKPKMSYEDAAKQAKKFQSGFSNNNKFIEACKTMGLQWTENRYEEENLKGAQHALITLIQSGTNPHVALKLGASKQLNNKKLKEAEEKKQAEEKARKEEERKQREKREIEEYNERMKEKWDESIKEQAEDKFRKKQSEDTQKSEKPVICSSFEEEQVFFKYHSNYTAWEHTLDTKTEYIFLRIKRRKINDSLFNSVNQALTSYEYPSGAPHSIRQIDDSMDKFELKRALQVTSFINAATARKIIFLKRDNKNYIENSYMRAYVSPPTNDKVKEKNEKAAAKLIITVPPGKGYGVWLYDPPTSARVLYTPEINNQFLLAHGLKFKIDDIENLESGNPTIRLTIVGKHITNDIKDMLLYHG